MGAAEAKVAANPHAMASSIASAGATAGIPAKASTMGAARAEVVANLVAKVSARAAAMADAAILGGSPVGLAWTVRYHGVCLSFPSARTFSKKLFSENGIIADQTSPPYQNRSTSSTLIALSPPSTGRFKRRCTHRGIAYPLGYAAMCATLAETLLPRRR